MKKTKWLALLMVAVLAFSAFTACGSDNAVEVLKDLPTQNMGEIYTDEAFSTSLGTQITKVDDKAYTTIKALTTLNYTDYQNSTNNGDWNNERLIIKATTDGSDTTVNVYDVFNANPETAIFTATNKEIQPVFFGGIFLVYETSTSTGELRRAGDGALLGEVNKRNVLNNSYYFTDTYDSCRVENYFSSNYTYAGLILKYNKTTKLVELAEGQNQDFLNKAEKPIGYKEINDNYGISFDKGVLTVYKATDMSTLLSNDFKTNDNTSINYFVLNNGNLLIQKLTYLDLIDTEFDFYSIDDGVNYKASIEHYLYDAGENEISELELGYCVNAVKNNAILDEDQPKVFVDSVKNVILLQAINEDKSLDFTKAVLADDDLTLTTLLTTNVASYSTLVPYLKLGNQKYYAVSNSFSSSSSYYVDANGSRISFNGNALANSSYLITDDKIYNFDGSVAFDAKAQEYTIKAAYNGVIILSKQIPANGSEPAYTQYSLYKDGSLSNLDKTLGVYGYDNYYATYNSTNGEIKLYNTNGAEISNVPAGGIASLGGVLGYDSTGNLYVLA